MSMCWDTWQDNVLGCKSGVGGEGHSEQSGD